MYSKLTQLIEIKSTSRNWINFLRSLYHKKIRNCEELDSHGGIVSRGTDKPQFVIGKTILLELFTLPALVMGTNLTEKTSYMIKV